MLTEERVAEVGDLIAKVRDWAAERSDVRGVGLVGLWSYGNATMDSDFDLLLLTTTERAYLDDELWVAELGGLRVINTARWGPVTERRFVLLSGLEIEVGVAPLSWAATDPVDQGTRRVVEGGMSIVYDPEGLLSRLSDACHRRDV